MNDIRNDFPQISDALAYLDNAATSFKPQCVIDALSDFYSEYNANARRGLYDLSVKATQMLEESRKTIATFIGANAKEIVFTSGTTDSINMLANMLEISPSDEVAICLTEHHSNMLPWRGGTRKITYINCDKTGYFKKSEIAKINASTKVVAVTAYSNVLGENLQLKEIIAKAHNVGAFVVVDAAQAAAHMKIDVKELDADFLAFSGHKVYGPMGIGVLYGKEALLAKLQPGKYGGEMVDEVTTKDFVLTEMPARFEAGTINVAGAVGLARALEYLQEKNFPDLISYEQKLCTYAFNKLREVPYLELASARSLTQGFSSQVCFWIHDVHSHDIASILNSNNIAIRAGFMCAQPLIESFGNGPICRISLSFYNTYAEIDWLVEVLKTVRKQMGLDG